MTVEERTLARLETLRAAAVVLDRIDNIVTNIESDEHAEAKQLGHVDGLQRRAKELADALQLSPAKAAAAIQRVRRDCNRNIARVERELEDGYEEGPTEYMGVCEADLILLRLWPAPLGQPPEECPSCGGPIVPGQQRAHTSADVWVCPACHLGE